jgi:hypothetical protein
VDCLPPVTSGSSPWFIAESLPESLVDLVEESLRRDNHTPVEHSSYSCRRFIMKVVEFQLIGHAGYCVIGDGA